MTIATSPRSKTLGSRSALERIETAWPGLGKYLTLLEAGELEFNLEPSDNKAKAQVSDLSPLRGIPLSHLRLTGAWEVRDLSPLVGMKLNTLHIRYTGVKDLAPLRGMPLSKLWLGSTVTDFTPIAGLSDLRKCPQWATLLLAPLSEDDLEAMFSTTFGGKQLVGPRSIFRHGIDGVRDALCRLGHLMDRYVEIAEIEMNPLIVSPNAGQVVAVDARVRLQEPQHVDL